MLNPMTFKHVRELYQRLAPERAELLREYAQFVYDTTWLIESHLGEYAGEKFDKDRLVDGVRACIFNQDEPSSQRSHKNLSKAFAGASLGEEKRQEFLSIAFDEACKRIEVGIYKDSQENIRFREHGHHGRQYISRNAEARAAEILLTLSYTGDRNVPAD